jgi:hypothetical protein
LFTGGIIASQIRAHTEPLEVTTEHHTSDVRNDDGTDRSFLRGLGKGCRSLSAGRRPLRCQRLLDDQHLGRAAELEVSIDDEVAIVDDIGSMGDMKTAGQLGTIRTKLWAPRANSRRTAGG